MSISVIILTPSATYLITWHRNRMRMKNYASGHLGFEKLDLLEFDYTCHRYVLWAGCCFTLRALKLAFQGVQLAVYRAFQE